MEPLPQKRGCGPALIFFALMLFSMRVSASWHTAPQKFVRLAPNQLAATEATSASKDKAPQFAPLDYFDRSCARCHGNYGTNYDPSLAKLPDAKLKQFVEDMAQGPGQAPLDAAQLERETAFHRSLQDGKPFIVVTKIEEQSSGPTLSGEATPDVKLSLQIGRDHSTVIALDRHLWSVNLPAGTDIQSVRLTAQKGEATTLLSLSESLFTHHITK
ncbi:MAG: hypothetical protein JWN98_2356 [Abditibacteriota bacterium]|nr:hypothetical protein [Abditibacteriota bacterium]